MSATAQENSIPIACVPGAVPTERRERWIETGKQVYGRADEVKELPDGHAFRLPGTAANLLAVAEYVSLDRLCCAFIRWSVVVEPGGGPLWLHVTGPEGTKQITRVGLETTDLLRAEVARAAGIHQTSRASVDVSSVNDVAVRGNLSAQQHRDALQKR